MLSAIEEEKSRNLLIMSFPAKAKKTSCPAEQLRIRFVNNIKLDAVYFFIQILFYIFYFFFCVHTW